MKWRACSLLLVATLSWMTVLTSCSRWDLLTADELDADQMWLTALVSTQCSVLGVSPSVRFTDEQFLIEGTPYDRPGEWFPAAMWYVKSSDTIIIWTDIIGRHPNAVLKAYAQHECCHAFYGDKKSTPEIEQRADRCVKERFE